MKRTIVVYGSSTGTCEAIANKIGTALGAEVIDVQDMKASTIAAADNLILGTLLGYDVCIQCQRFCQRKTRKSAQRDTA